MVTANGIVTRVTPDRIIAVFFIDGVQQTFNATVFPSMQPFTTNSADLTYDTVDDLTGQHSYHGQLGTDSFSLEIDNGPKMTGDLNVPGIHPAARVEGTGTWESG